MFEKIKKYCKESYNELVNQTTWPTRSELMNSAVVVFSINCFPMHSTGSFRYGLRVPVWNGSHLWFAAIKILLGNGRRWNEMVRIACHQW